MKGGAEAQQVQLLPEISWANARLNINEGVLQAENLEAEIEAEAALQRARQLEAELQARIAAEEAAAAARELAIQRARDEEQLVQGVKGGWVYLNMLYEYSSAKSLHDLFVGPTQPFYPTMINYVISSHGTTPPYNGPVGNIPSFIVPENTSIMFYTPHSYALQCPNVHQTQICSKNLNLVNNIDEVFIQNSKCINYILTGEDGAFKSGAVNCDYVNPVGIRKSFIVQTIEVGEHFSLGHIVLLINNYHRRFYGGYPYLPRIAIHCLFCRGGL